MRKDNSFGTGLAVLILCLSSVIFWLFSPGVADADINDPTITFTVAPTTAAAGDNITIRVRVEHPPLVPGAGCLDIASDVAIILGNGDVVTLWCNIPYYGACECEGEIRYSYGADGVYSVQARAHAPVEDKTWFSNTVQITIGGMGICDGVCNGVCLPACGGDVGRDPDCGCLSGDGCCGLGCDNASDDDCAADVVYYRNPLVWNEIIAFVWGAIMYIFGHAIVLAVLMILIGAYVLATSGGNAARVQLGKRIIIWTIIGYVVMLLARGVIMFIIRFPSS